METFFARASTVLTSLQRSSLPICARGVATALRPVPMRAITASGERHNGKSPLWKNEPSGGKGCAKMKPPRWLPRIALGETRRKCLPNQERNPADSRLNQQAHSQPYSSPRTKNSSCRSLTSLHFSHQYRAKLFHPRRFVTWRRLREVHGVRGACSRCRMAVSVEG